MENKQSLKSSNLINENRNVLVNNPNTANKSKFLDLELGDAFSSAKSKNSTNYNNDNISSSNLAQQTNTQTDNTAQNNKTNSFDVLLLNFILKNISNGFKPTKTQISFILKNKNIDTDSVNYWFKLFVERLIKINRNKKRS